ncbi:MAG: hypothetical protein NWF04_10745 [Candidatus Bathyarchaeota archaeon]|nr:hypothetical protein [Candidatus Bathyarchaeota archaeon]
MKRQGLIGKSKDFASIDKQFRAAVLVGLMLSGVFLATGIGYAVAAEAPATNWSQTYGGTDQDDCYCAIQTSDGGYALAGSMKKGGHGTDFWLVKTDANGVMQWNQTYNMQYQDFAYCIIQTSDGGYALAGIAGVDAWLVKTDANGVMQWNQTYDGGNWDEVRGVIQTMDGGYALAGSTLSYGADSYDYWFIKTDAVGHELWNQTYGGANADNAYGIIQTSDNGYMLVGSTESYGEGSIDVWAVKTDIAGNMQWNQTYGTANIDLGYCATQTNDKGYALAGRSNDDFWLVKINAAGEMQWNQTYGGAKVDEAVCIISTSDGGYALAGSTESFSAGRTDFWVVKVDAAGNPQWNQSYGGRYHDRAYCIIETSDGAYALAGHTQSYGEGSYDYWLIKTTPDSLLVVPEYSLGIAGALAACLAALLLTTAIKKRHKTPT